MSNYIYIAVSLDGYIARKDGSIDWLTEIENPDGGDFGFSDFMQSIDAIVMGRNTFESVLGFNQWIYTKPVYVLSSTLKSIPQELSGKAYLIDGDPNSVVKELKSLNLENLYIDGGVTVQNFLRENLIDDMIITRIPILLGEGLPLFGSLKDSIKFQHISTILYNNSLVKSHYKRIQ